MKNRDVELVHRILDGDDTAFTQLVKKYQKPVHALVWRKIGDFHIAEEITQDTFLKAYEKLATLKEPQNFASWMYVIATRQCVAWLRKKRLWTQTPENTESTQLEKTTYSGYVIEENERMAVDAQREVVKKLLGKLQESERTIITLRYFGEMSSAEIGEFLGVSANTIRSRLHRAQQRLKKEEPMIREALNSFQPPTNLTENIMREIARIKPVAPSGGKPLVPWTIIASTVAVVLLMAGVGNQYLTRFQQPYNFDAASEMTVDIIEAPVVLNFEFKPDIRHQMGNSSLPSKNDGSAQQPNQSEYLPRITVATEDETVTVNITDTNKGKRYITFSAITNEESGASLAGGTFSLIKTDKALTTIGYGTQGTGKGDPTPMYMLMSYMFHSGTDLFRFPLVIGDTWSEKRHKDSRVKTTVEGYEQVEIAADTFLDCLKHKTVITEAEAGSPLRDSLVNGTRYLWFAKGVGIVKMRYEHANGIITEAELLEYKIPTDTTEYLPLQVNNAWTYKWQNGYRNEAAIEKCKIVDNADKQYQDTSAEKVVRTIPDLSEKVSTDLKEIRIVFNESMIGIDVGFAGVPVGDIRWADDNTTLVISLEQQLQASKIYRLILGGEGNIRDIAGNPLEEHILTFTTEGPEPVTPTFVDTEPIGVKGIEELDLSSEVFCRVSTDFTDGFAFPYYLFVPHGINFNKPVHLLVEPCNTGPVRGFKILDRKTRALAENSHATAIARRLKVPLLVPVFPRPSGDRWKIYTHALDRDTLLINDGELRRIDLQLIKMIAHAQKLLRHNNVKVNEKVFMNGFSASGTFTNRFAILHPTVVRAVATGGVNSIPTFPTDRWSDTTMRYPVGIADVKEIADIEFDEMAYKRVSQYIYMGALDDNDTVPYRDAYDEVDAELVKTLIGDKMMPDRWHMSQSIYKALGIPAQFVTYENTGHQIKDEIVDDIVVFFKANSVD